MKDIVRSLTIMTKFDSLKWIKKETNVIILSNLLILNDRESCIEKIITEIALTKWDLFDVIEVLQNHPYLHFRKKD